MNPTETPLASTGTTQDASCDAGRVKVAPTAARPVKSDSSHWYTKTGEPAYEIAKKDGSGMRPVTLADARKLNLLPSVTNVLGVLDKPGLNLWKQEQCVLAAVTTPRYEAESVDEFIYRVLHTEKQQDGEGLKARNRGDQFHTALERLCKAKRIDDEIAPWVLPAFEALNKRRRTVACVEVVLVGSGYAGKTDLIQRENDSWWLWDWKSAKTLPTKGAWTEHRLQLAAYADAWLAGVKTEVRTGNVYISTVECGKFVICENPPWGPDYEAFRCLLQFWQWQNNYRP